MTKRTTMPRRYRLKQEYITGIPYAGDEAILDAGTELTLCLVRGSWVYVPTWRYDYLFFKGKPFLNYEILVPRDVVESNPAVFEEIK